MTKSSKNFANILVSLINAEENLTDDDIAEEYQKLREISHGIRDSDTSPIRCGLKLINLKKNRYKDIIPYDFNRIKLTSIRNEEGSDYINASSIELSGVPTQRYIAAQGPLVGTLRDFWRMLSENDVKIVVMACQEVEMARKKCHRYWPLVNEPLEVAGYRVELIAEKKYEEHYVRRQLRYSNIRCPSITRTLLQFQILEWPDYGVTDTSFLIDIMGEINSKADPSSQKSPLLVNCSAGCGRTGTFIAINHVYLLLQTKHLSADFKLWDVLESLRRQRTAMVQTKDQCKLVHSAVRFLFKRSLQEVNGAIYENNDSFLHKDTTKILSKENVPTMDQTDVFEGHSSSVSDANRLGINGTVTLRTKSPTPTKPASLPSLDPVPRKSVSRFSRPVPAECILNISPTGVLFSSRSNSDSSDSATHFSPTSAVSYTGHSSATQKVIESPVSDGVLKRHIPKESFLSSFPTSVKSNMAAPLDNNAFYSSVKSVAHSTQKADVMSSEMAAPPIPERHYDSSEDISAPTTGDESFAKENTYSTIDICRGKSQSIKERAIFVPEESAYSHIRSVSQEPLSASKTSNLKHKFSMKRVLPSSWTSNREAKEEVLITNSLYKAGSLMTSIPNDAALVKPIRPRERPTTWGPKSWKNYFSVPVEEG